MHLLLYFFEFSDFGALSHLFSLKSVSAIFNILDNVKTSYFIFFCILYLPLLSVQ